MIFALDIYCRHCDNDYAFDANRIERVPLRLRCEDYSIFRADCRMEGSVASDSDFGLGFLIPYFVLIASRLG